MKDLYEALKNQCFFMTCSNKPVLSSNTVLRQSILVKEKLDKKGNDTCELFNKDNNRVLESIQEWHANTILILKNYSTPFLTKE